MAPTKAIMARRQWLKEDERECSIVRLLIYKSDDRKAHDSGDLHNFRFLAGLNLFGGHSFQQTSIQAQVTRFSIAIVQVESGQFKKRHEKEDLEVNTPTDRSGGTKDVRVGVSFTRNVKAQLLHNNAANSKHANATVLDFGPTGVFQVGLDVGTV